MLPSDKQHFIENELEELHKKEQLTLQQVEERHDQEYQKFLTEYAKLEDLIYSKYGIPKKWVPISSYPKPLSELSELFR